MTTIGPATTKRKYRARCKACGNYEEAHGDSETHNFEPRPRGFAAMPREKVQEIASRGGKEAHRQGTAHQFTEEEARAAGIKGGKAPHRVRGTTVIVPKVA